MQVDESCLGNPEIVMNQIEKWVDEHNEFAAHSALDMKTPKEYFSFNKAA